MDHPATILVTGAEGFAGRALCRHLASVFPGAAIMGSTRAGEPVAECTRTIPLDLSNGDISGALRNLRPDLVYHLAARSSVAQSLGSGDLTFSDNVTSCLRLASALRAECPGTPVVFASSGEVYGGAFNRAVPVSESTPPEPMNAYARSKLAGEFVFLDTLSAVSPVALLRLFNHFGRGQDERFVIATFAAQLRAIAAGQQSPVIRVGNLDATRDFLPLNDVLDAYVRAGRLLLAASPGARLFNIASGKGRTIRSVLDDLITLSGQAVAVEIDPARLRASDIPSAIGDARAFAEATGWAPEVDWSAALRALII